MADTSTEGVRDVPRIKISEPADHVSTIAQAAQDAYPIGSTKAPSAPAVDVGGKNIASENTGAASKATEPKLSTPNANAEGTTPNSVTPDAKNAVYPDPYGRGKPYGKSDDSILNGKYRNSDADIINNANDLQALNDKYLHWYSSMSSGD